MKAKTGSLATFREDVCFHHILGYKGREQRHTVQWQLPPDRPPYLQWWGRTGGILGWPRILKSRASTELGGKNWPWGPKSKFQAHPCHCASSGT